MVILWLMMVKNDLVGGFTHLESQWEGLHPINPIYEMEKYPLVN